MQNKIRNLKQRIDKNYSKLIMKYGDSCQLAIPIIEMIDILIEMKASDETITIYLKNIESSLIIIEEKLHNVENL